MSKHDRERIRESGYERAGFATAYDQARPRPPEALLDLLIRLARVERRPALVVDLGSGTGLSTLAWVDRAEQVVGVEANHAMLGQARHQAQSLGCQNVRFELGFADSTGLSDGCADIVTAAQAFHWMEPEPVLAEAARILRDGGVFAAYDYDWPPAVDWEVDAAFSALLGRDWNGGLQYEAKERHLERLRASGRFRWTKELLVHSVEDGTAERLVGLALSLGPISRAAAVEARDGLAELRAVAQRRLGDAVVPFHFSYRVRAAVR